MKVIFSFTAPDTGKGISIGEDNINGIENGIENSDESKVLVLIQKEPGITIKKMSEILGFSIRKINRIIKTLRESGKISRVGSDRKGYCKTMLISVL